MLQVQKAPCFPYCDRGRGNQGKMQFLWPILVYPKVYPFFLTWTDLWIIFNCFIGEVYQDRLNERSVVWWNLYVLLLTWCAWLNLGPPLLCFARHQPNFVQLFLTVLYIVCLSIACHCTVKFLGMCLCSLQSQGFNVIILTNTGSLCQS